MKLKNFRRPQAIIFGALAIAVAGGIIAGIAGFRSAEAQKIENRVEIERRTPISADRNNMIYNRLSTLLAGQNVNFDAAKMLPNQVADSATVHVNLKATGTNTFVNGLSEIKPETGSIEFLNSKTSADRLTRQRNFELSPTQILIVSLNAEKQVLWWDLQPDPRIFRAESADDNGVLSGKTLYRADADLLVGIPAAQGIRELAFYSPVWDGSDYSLKIIGNLVLPAGE